MALLKAVIVDPIILPFIGHRNGIQHDTIGYYVISSGSKVFINLLLKLQKIIYKKFCKQSGIQQMKTTLRAKLDNYLDQNRVLELRAKSKK